jgi:spermidine synthase
MSLAGESAEFRDGSWRAGLLPIVATVFFFSGFSSLIYEVIWMRRLALFFGSDVYSAACTLSVFMGGLTLGSLLAARFTDRLRRTLLWYGMLEISIGLYALFFPDILNLFSSQYQHVYRAYFDIAPWRYHACRILVATVTLIVPTTMMGATLPLIVKRFGRDGEIGRYSGFFYSTNTCGALVGVLCVGFVFLPALGVQSTTALACKINILIGITAILLSRLRSGKVPGEPYGTPTTARSTAGILPDRRFARVSLIAIALSGFAALALEVVWMRILTQSFSATVYSFSIMLSCFLFGIFYGSRWISGLVDREQFLVRLFGLLELGLGLCVAMLGIFTYFVPLFFSRLLWLLSAISKGNFGLACTVAEFFVSAVLIAVPTILMGATFPVAVKICTPALAAIGRGIGTVYAANTAGGILGALLGGMVLIPVVGTRMGLLIIAAIFTGAGMFLLYQHSEGGWKNLKDPRAAVMLGVATLSAAIVWMLPGQIVVNFSYAGREQAQVIYHGEGIAHNVDIVRTPEDVTIMMVNGTLEADTTFSQRRHFILKGHLPLLLHGNPQSVAVIGLGLGITLSATNRNPAVHSIEVIELTREMVKAQRYLENISGGVLRSPKIHVRIDDGRNFMAMSDRSFDMITADPIHPRVTGVGYLYTREYYQSLKHRLRPHGVVCQWMPMYRISRKSFDVAFRTFASVFPNASFWYVRGHGLFVATQDPFQIDFQNLAARMQNPIVKDDLASIDVHSAPELLALMLMGPLEISKYLSSVPDHTLNRDDNAYLEYHTPFEFLDSTKIIVTALLPYAAPDLHDVFNISAQEKEEVIRAWNRRRAELLPELNANLN